jgi:tetratricopeptide (TPR) repeat protein
VLPPRDWPKLTLKFDLKAQPFIFGLILLHSLSSFGAEFDESRAIVCLQTDFSEGKPKIGTGFFISPTLIATAAHQVTEVGVDAIKITAYLHNQDAMTAKFPIVAEGDGLALLEIPDNLQSKYLLLQDNVPDEGDKVTAVGCQQDRNLLVRKGNVLRQADGNNARQGMDALIALNLPIQSGFSGGPLLSENSHAVGIIYGYEQGSKSLSYAITGRKLFKLMADQKVPHFSKTLFQQGALAFSLKQYPLAKQYFEQATQQQTDYAEAYISLGMAQFKLRQFAEARDALLEAILINADYPLAYFHLGGVYREGLSDRRSARNAYRRYLELDPNSNDAAQVRTWLRELEPTFAN